MWCDQAKSVRSQSNSVFIFLTNCMHYYYSYILLKTPLKLVNWFQRYEQLKDAKNIRKQKTFSALFGSILKSIFPTSEWFCLNTSHTLTCNSAYSICPILYNYVILREFYAGKIRCLWSQLLPVKNAPRSKGRSKATQCNGRKKKCDVRPCIYHSLSRGIGTWKVFISTWYYIMRILTTIPIH